MNQLTLCSFFADVYKTLQLQQCSSFAAHECSFHGSGRRAAVRCITVWPAFLTYYL